MAPSRRRPCRTVLLSATDDDTEQFITAARQDRLALVPHRLAADQSERSRELLVWAAMHGVGLLGLTALVLPALTLLALAASTLLRGAAAAAGSALLVIYLVFVVATVRRVRFEFARSGTVR